MRIRAFVVVVVVVLMGCYSYVPVAVSGPPPGSRASLVLTDEGTVEMARFVGPSASTIEGDVVSANGEGLLLAVRRLERRDGIEEFWKGEQVQVPRAAVATYTERKLSRARTVLFGAGAVAAVFVLGKAFGEATGIFGRNGGGTGSEK